LAFDFADFTGISFGTGIRDTYSGEIDDNHTLSDHIVFPSRRRLPIGLMSFPFRCWGGRTHVLFNHVSALPSEGLCLNLEMKTGQIS
jgi:hypothetical protein